MSASHACGVPVGDAIFIVTVPPLLSTPLSDALLLVDDIVGSLDMLIVQWAPIVALMSQPTEAAPSLDAEGSASAGPQSSASTAAEAMARIVFISISSTAWPPPDRLRPGHVTRRT